MSSVRRIEAGAPPKIQWGGLLLYFLALPLIPAVVIALGHGEVIAALANCAAFALTFVGATFIRRGLRLQTEATKRAWKRRASPKPYRLIGAVMVSVAMFLVAWLGVTSNGGHGLVVSILFALASLAGCYLYYDFDASARKDDVPLVGITTEELIDLLDEAEDRIEAIEFAGKSIKNTEFRDRLRRITQEARKITGAIEEDPTDARRARKFLKVYLDGAQQVTEGYARMHATDNTEQLEDNFRRVLTTIETVIADQQQKLKENNVSELDVQIEVLQMQLENEGVV